MGESRETKDWGKGKGMWKERTCMEQAANGTCQHDSRARRQILLCERGYARLRLRLCSHILTSVIRERHQLMSVPLCNEQRLAGMQRRHQWISALDGCHGNGHQTNKLKKRRAPSSVMSRWVPCAWHFALPGKIMSAQRRRCERWCLVSRALVAALVDCKTAQALILLCTTDFCAWGGALNFASMNELSRVLKGLARDEGWLKDVAAEVQLVEFLKVVGLPVWGDGEEPLRFSPAAGQGWLIVLLECSFKQT